jgi:hypothetical protein
MSRAITRVERALDPSEPVVQRRAVEVGDRPVKMGFLGPFRGLLTFSQEHFEALPATIEGAVFDLEMKGVHASYLAPIVRSYEAFPEGADRAREVARAVNAADLDCLLLVHRGAEAYKIVDLVETPCLINVATGSDLMHNDRVGAQVFVQREADYFIRDGRLFCGTTRSYFPDETVSPGFLLYDRRGLRDPVVPIPQRDKLVVFHGSLYKLASTSFLQTVFRLLQEDPGLEFVYVGGRNDVALSTIEQTAKVCGVAPRVHYDGEYSGMRGTDSGLDDPAWDRLVTLLQRARFAPNPWPVGGASAVVETFALGVPSAQMTVRTDHASWGRPQHAFCDLEALLVADGTATTIDGYLDISRRCLYDDTFATTLVTAQLEVLDRVTDASRYWAQILDVYAAWGRRAGVRAQSRLISSGA